MKHLVLTAVLVSGAALAATDFTPVASGTLTSGTTVVREFVRNDTAAAWALDFDWQWAGGVLTHYPFIDTGSAKQVSMPALTAGKMYRIDVTFTGYLRGSVAISLGGESFEGYGNDGWYTLRLHATDPNAPLTLTPTVDYEGSIASIHVVELGNEMVDVTNSKWSADGKFLTAAGHELVVEQFGVVTGRTYQLTFTVAEATGAVRGANVGLGRREKGFSHNGFYSFDVVAQQDGRLVFEPEELDSMYDGKISAVSVREITSDPTSTNPSHNR